MGSLVWTSPSALKFQINRVDGFGCDSTTVSFPQADSDYAAGCGYVDIHVAEGGDDVFEGKTFAQNLSLYDGIMSAQGHGLTARVVACPNPGAGPQPGNDVFAIEIDDRRKRPTAISVNLRMLRYAIQR